MAPVGTAGYVSVCQKGEPVSCQMVLFEKAGDWELLGHDCSGGKVTTLGVLSENEVFYVYVEQD
jgi:hypothetical protein